MTFTLFAFKVVYYKGENIEQETSSRRRISRRVVLKGTKIAERDFIKLFLYVPAAINSEVNIQRITKTTK
jgi:hypothetical protein